MNVENFDAFRRLISNHEGVFVVFALFGRESSSKVALLVSENELFILFLILLVDRLLRPIDVFTFLLAGLRVRSQTENIIRHGPLLPPALFFVHIIIDSSHVLEWQSMLRHGFLRLFGHGRGPLELSGFFAELRRLICVVYVILFHRVWNLLNLHIKASVLVILP